MFYKTNLKAERKACIILFYSKDVNTFSELVINAKFTEKHFCRSLFYNEVAGWKTEIFRNSHWRCSVKQGVFKK